MSGWHDRQSAIRTTIICLVLFISIAAGASLAGHKNQIQRKNRSKVDVQRLYVAYRDRMKEESSTSDGDRAGMAEDKVDARSIEEMRIEASANPPQNENKLKLMKLLKVATLPMMYDATDEHQNGKNKRLGSPPVQDGQGGGQRSDNKRPLVSGTLIVKMELPDPINPAAQKGFETVVTLPTGEPDLRIADLNRIYKEYLKLWQQPIKPPLPVNTNKETSTIKSVQNAQTEALNELANLIQRLEQGNPITEMTKKLNEKLQLGREPLKNIMDDMEAQLMTHNDQQSDDFIEVLRSMKPDMALKVFKRVADEMSVLRGHIQAGGLYDEYKKRLLKILKEQKNTRELNNEKQNPSECARKSNELAQCRCDAAKPATFAAEMMQSPGKFYARNKKPGKMKVVSKTKQKTKFQEGMDDEYLQALGTFMSKGNGGSKPYYLPNSKNRQLVWNEVPLLKKAEAATKMGASGSNIAKNAKTQLATVVAAKGMCNSSDHAAAGGDSAGFADNLKSKFERPIVIAWPLMNQSADPYPGVNPKHITAAMKAFQQSSFFSLYDEYQKQLLDLNKVLKAKQLWWNEARGKTGGGSEDINPAEVPAERSGVEPALASLQESNPPAFPQVLTQAFDMSMNPPATGQQGGVLQHMASQLNMSPVELAQRITNAGNPPDLSSRNEAPFVMSPAPYPGPASQISAMPAPIAPITPIVPVPTTAPIAPIVTPVPAPNSAPIDPIVTPVPVTNAVKTNLTESIPPILPSVHFPPPVNLAPILDKILQRLETIQDFKHQLEAQECEPIPTTEKPLPCCFADPTNGAPCNLTGSWESLLLGVRINIKGDVEVKSEEEPAKPTCSQPRLHRGSSSAGRNWRQCVKITPTQIKALGETTPAPDPGASKYLNITVQETVPPRAHEILENVTDWTFTGHTLSVVGGPLALSCHRKGTNMIGAFVGYCRTCGCVDTIFGSWTFCTPSHDCQDITTSIFERRDLLRRYSMDDKRKERFKEQLYNRSKFGKAERQRLLDEKEKASKPRN